MKIFIGSSKEVSFQNGLLDKIALIVSQCGITPLRWNQTPSIFKAGTYTLESLEEIISAVDAAIFICTSDDKTWYRGKKVGKPRDNVIFEYGLFLGKLGRKKSLILKYGKINLPNDLDGVTYIDFSEGQEIQGELNLKQCLFDLKGTASSLARIPYEELEKTKHEIEYELNLIKKKGLEKVFVNQKQAIEDFKKNHQQFNNEPIRILCIRGDSFVSNREGNWGSEILVKQKETVILGDPRNEDLIMYRYKANKNFDESEVDFLERYKEEMKAVQQKIGKRTKNLLLHNEIKLKYRMLFIGSYLYLSRFEGTTASNSEVIKIPKGFTLYSVCEDHFNQIITHANKV